MRQSTVSVLALVCVMLAGCGSSPTDPMTDLSVTFSGTFTPSSVSANGVCTLELEAQPTGGEPPYRCTWNMNWINQASSARGYPDRCSQNISLPDGFGPGLYPVDLAVRDHRDKDEEIARAGTDEVFDCSGDSQLLFFGAP